MSLLDVFRRRPARPPLVVPPASVITVPMPKANPDIVHLRAQVSRLHLEADAARSSARRATERAERAEQALCELLIAKAGDSTDEVLRLRRALLRLEDFAAGCRKKHGSNTSSGNPLPAHAGVPA